MCQPPIDRFSSSRRLFRQKSRSHFRDFGAIPMMPQYRVVLHGDAMQDLMLIVAAVMELMHFYRDEAMLKMWRAHHFGTSCLLVTYRERGELFVEQFASRGLRVTLEPA